MSLFVLVSELVLESVFMFEDGDVHNAVVFILINCRFRPLATVLC